MIETWLPAVDFESFYLISDLGNVFSIKSDRLLHPAPDGWGYPHVTLCDGVKQKHIKVHTLVLTTFVGPRPDGLEALHDNDIKIDCRLSNLSWGTHSKNVQDAVRNGTLWQTKTTECPQGHKYTPENTDIREYERRGKLRKFRYCKQCQRDRGFRKAI
jgi:hypothetical protein